MISLSNMSDLHGAGRREGERGRAISFCVPGDQDRFRIPNSEFKKGFGFPGFWNL
jgi:hypothetical protein